MRQLKKKQEQEQEHKKKRGADVATRKRQRDEEERREKERKKKCIEEARKQQTRPMERKHANNDKEAHPEAHVSRSYIVYVYWKSSITCLYVESHECIHLFAHIVGHI